MSTRLVISSGLGWNVSLLERESQTYLATTLIKACLKSQLAALL